MDLNPIALALLITCLKIQLVHNQYSNGYGSCDYAYYGYGQPDYTQTGHPTYSQLGCDYQSSYNPHRAEQPTVIVLSDMFNDKEKLMDFINFIASLTNGLIVIPYPVPRCDDDSDMSCLDYVPQTRGCGCYKCENYETCDDGCNCNCGCRNQEQSRSISNSRKHSDTDCSSKKNPIIHKSECCCRS